MLLQVAGLLHFYGWIHCVSLCVLLKYWGGNPTISELNTINLRTWLLYMSFSWKLQFIQWFFYALAFANSATLGMKVHVYVSLWDFVITWTFLRGDHTQRCSGVVPASAIRNYSWCCSGDHIEHQGSNLASCCTIAHPHSVIIWSMTICWQHRLFP